MFTETFDKYACFGDTITTTKDGFEVTASIEQDYHMGPPWEEHDGHGPVSDWRRKESKRPGERILHEDGGSCRFYDFEEAVEIAKRDGWCANTVDAELERVGSITKGERAARAAEADFEVLKAWCNDEWHWCSVSLSVSKNGIDLDPYAVSLCGIEMNYPGGDNSYLTEVANELLDEAVKAGRAAALHICSALKCC